MRPRFFTQAARIGVNTLLAVVLVVFATGCDKARIFDENHDLEGNIWRVTEKPVFPFVITDTAARYSVYLNVRTTTSYPFYNLFVKLALTGPQKQVVSRRLHELNVRDPQTGQPLGNGAGDIFDQQVLALRGVRFAQAGPYRVQLEQYMRLGELPNVMAVGVRVARETPAAAPQ